MNLASVLLLAFAALVGLVMHELAHAVAADRMGDPTPRVAGRLTLNPLAHLDFLGTLMLLVTGRFGWAKPVPVNFANVRPYRLGLIWISLAGPLANLIIALLASLPLRAYFSGGLLAGEATGQAALLLLRVLMDVNLGLALFNLLPIPPLDGAKVVQGLLPPRYSLRFEQLESYGPIILVLFLVIPGAVSAVLGPAFSFLYRLILGV